MKFSFQGTPEELSALVRHLQCDNHLTLTGGHIMFTVKADHPDVPYTITLPTLTDSEGNKLPTNAEDFEFTVESSNPEAVEIVPDEDDNPLTGNVTFGGPGEDGAPNLGSVNVMGIHTPSGKGFSFGAQFTVTAGDPSDIAGGTIAFEGLTEDEEGGEEEEEEPGL